ncbi:DUF3099 domain-containing protein [Microbacterium sp. CIAB417]|uniref:DUF3099 domain-containing protein n=1 Tax=Microbacterium sp. CIAB417 TaxID=2860287 RepID=UPI001FAC1E84|nr:DUF3099 domain-containing protein [Microbacterium sp. CIAB417]
MKHTRDAASVTSLPQSPKAEADSRTRRYLISMSIRMVCFALALFVTPYGWYTWVFAIAAGVLPYIAVVAANAGSDSTVTRAESPQQALEAPTGKPSSAPVEPPVIRISEKGRDAAP